MIAYFDTSALIPLLIDEPTSDTAGDLWMSATRIVASRLVYPEACSALARAKRGGRLSPRHFRRSMRELVSLDDQIDHVEVTAAVARIAGEMTEKHELRAYDAVHLASASLMNDEDFVFVTNDLNLREAALTTGLSAARLR